MNPFWLALVFLAPQQKLPFCTSGEHFAQCVWTGIAELSSNEQAGSSGNLTVIRQVNVCTSCGRHAPCSSYRLDYILCLSILE